MNAPKEPIEVSVVMPCLNEADTLARCIEKAWAGLKASGRSGEVIVADNGSTDGSGALADAGGARLINVEAKGYGSALMGGISAARGKFVVMADADDSYDFLELPQFIEKLDEGCDLVQGCRLPGGGGTVLPGAMPFLHRWWGNPMFTFLARSWFRAPIHDVYCGMRAFTRSHYQKLDLRCTGMEFATEMIIKSALYRSRIGEVPITLHPDGRKAHAPHLKTFRDGWRTLRFFLLCSPRWLFLWPGAVLVALGWAGYGLAMPGLTVHGITFDAHTLLFASLAILCGFQSILFALLTKTFAVYDGLLPEDPGLARFYRVFNLETGLVCAGIALLIGVGLLLTAVNQWRLTGFGHLDYARTMRLVVPGATLTALGFQTILFSFFASMLGLKRR